MTKIHEANRRLWNNQAPTWEERLNRDGRWRRCHKEPELAFEGETLATIREMVGDLRNKQVCIIGSGDNMAAYALSGLGAVVTSTDISEERLKLAADRANTLNVSIDFVRSDAADLGFAADSTFDLVCSTNGFFVWIADLGAVFREVSRILKPGGTYVFYDIHPFMRPWKDQTIPIEMEKSYWETGPFQESADESYEFSWTLADLLRTCFKKQGLIPRCCGFVNPQRAVSQGRGWGSQPIGLGNQAPTIDLTRFAEYGDNMPLNSGRPSGLRKNPSFEEKTRFPGK